MNDLYYNMPKLTLLLNQNNQLGTVSSRKKENKIKYTLDSLIEGLQILFIKNLRRCKTVFFSLKFLI